MGKIRFDAFMEHALHHPTHGYYSRRIKSVGPDGDFSTTSSLSSILGKRIALWIQTEANKHHFSTIPVIEIGAGTGKLMKDIRSALPFLVRRKCSFHIVETSEPLRQTQQNNLPKTKWSDSVKEILEKTNGKALIYTNELVDAFPVRVFRKQDHAFEELYIDTKNRGEYFQVIPENALPQSSFFKQSIANNVRFEVHQSYLEWIEEWAPQLRKGSVLTIDYGDSCENLLKFNPRGSLRGYLRHQVVKGSALYQNVGHQDITADVNFTDLEAIADNYGWTNSLYSTQRDFLEGLEHSAADYFLSDSSGAGAAFKVLCQQIN